MSELSLTVDGIEMIAYPQKLQDAVQDAASAWRAFLQLPDTIKNQFAGEDLQFTVGYERKLDQSRQSNDHKENFDITSGGMAELVQRTDGVNEKEAKAFLDASRILLRELEPAIVAYGRHIENDYSLVGFEATAKASAASCFVRFLHYPAVPSGTIIGEPHTDHSGFTFHLYESTSGCERLDYDRQKWQEMPVAADQAAAFGGMQLQLVSQGEIKALCHQIVANHVTSLHGRIAIVCFVLLADTPRYDRRSHGRLQEYPAGFNYTLADPDFRALFTS